MRVRRACQTITWGADQSERFDEIFSIVAAAGFQGVEIGYRHIQNVLPEQLNALLSKHGLTLSATHVGGNLEDLGQAGEERSVLDEVMDYLEAIGVCQLLYSGLKGSSVDAVSEEIAMVGRSAKKAASRGIRLLYHNHNWEYCGSGIMEALLAEAPPELGLCPDIGWLMRAGVDVQEFLNANQERIGAIHFKDFATVDSSELDTVPLGCGVAPLHETAAWIRDTCNLEADSVWVVAEQDRHAGPVEEAIEINGQFLRKEFGGCE